MQLIERLKRPTFVESWTAIPEALPWDLYHALEASFPDPKKIVGTRDEGSNILLQYPAAQALADPEIPEVWKTFITEVTSKAFLKHLYDVPDEATVGVRFTGVYDFNMECQFGVNTPVKEFGQVRGPHVDNPIELYAFLIYFRDVNDDSHGGDLALYRWKEGVTRRFHGKAEIEDSLVTEIGRVPYSRNSAVFLVNDSINAIHGVTARYPSPHYRRYVNIVAEVNAAQYELPR